MKTKAIIFDYDGVITDTENFRRDVLNELIKEKGLMIEDSDKRLIGRKTHHFLEEAFPTIKEEERRKIRELWRERRLQEPTPLIKGAKEAMIFARDKFSVAIVTGSERKAVEQTLNYFNIKGFQEIVSGEDFSSSKPDPECYHIVLERMKLLPEEVVIIEDSIAGIQSGKNASCTVFGLGTYHEKEELLAAGADKYFKNHEKLLRFLKAT